MLRTADRSPQRSYSGNLHCSPATESHLHLTEARARQHRSRNGGDGRGAFRATFEMVQKLWWYKNPPFDFTWFVEGFAFDKPLSSKFVEKKFVEGSLTIIGSSLNFLKKTQ